MTDSKTRQATGLRVSKWLREAQQQHDTWQSRVQRGEVPAQAVPYMLGVVEALEGLLFRLHVERESLQKQAKETKRQRERAA